MVDIPDTLLRKFPTLTLLNPPELEEKWQQRGVFLIPPKITTDLDKLSGVVLNAAFSGNQSPLYFIIHSSGGQTTPGWLLYNAIRNYPGATIGVVIGKASSTAFTLLQACKFRFALPGATGLIHSMSAQIPITAFNPDEIALRQKIVVEETELTLQCLANRNPLITIDDLRALAKLNEPFLLTPETGWVDDTLEQIPPLHPLPEKWQQKVDGLCPRYKIT